LTAFREIPYNTCPGAGSAGKDPPSARESEDRSMDKRVFVPALLVALAFAFFWPLVLHPGKVLCSNSSDVLAQHLPYKRFVARSWQETGEIPLWCPHSLGGTPLIHDPQVSLFYPPNLPLLFAPDRLAGAAFSWLIVMQIILGGLFAFAYAREMGLN